MRGEEKDRAQQEKERSQMKRRTETTGNEIEKRLMRRGGEMTRGAELNVGNVKQE